MEFKTLAFQPITEKISFKYTIPKGKKQLMYDFYLLTALPLWGLGGIKGTKAPHAEGPAMEMLALDAQKKIVNYLKDELLDVVHFALASEFRHAFAFSRYSKMEKLLGAKVAKKYVDSLNIMSDNWHNDINSSAELKYDHYIESFFEVEDFFDLEKFRKVSYKATKKAFPSAEKFVKAVEKVFSDNMWKNRINTSGKRRWSDYGGPSWSNIAKGWQKLNKANSFGDKVVYIDHIFDLQHNTDSVLNKSAAYADTYGMYTWIGTALHTKKHATSLFELIDDASVPLKGFSARVIKAATGETLEKWAKSTKVPR